MLVFFSSPEAHVWIRIAFPTSVAGPCTAPLVLTSLPSKSQQLAPLPPRSTTCWATGVKESCQLPQFPWGGCRSHPPGHGLLEQSTGLRKGRGWGVEESWLALPVSVCGAALPSVIYPTSGTHGHRWDSSAGALGAGAGWQGSPPGWDTAGGDSEGWGAPQAAATTGMNKQGAGPRPWEQSHPLPWSPDPPPICLLHLLGQVRLQSSERPTSPQTRCSPPALIPEMTFLSLSSRRA